MDQHSDIYLYFVGSPDRMVRVKDVNSDTAQDISDRWWDASVENDVMIVSPGDEWWIAGISLGTEPDILDATMDDWFEAAQKHCREDQP